MAPKDLPEDDIEIPIPTSPVQPARKKQKGIVIQDVDVAASAPPHEVVGLTSSGGAEPGREVPLVQANPRLFRRIPDQSASALPHETEVELTRLGKTPVPVAGEERVIVDESLLASFEEGMPHFETTSRSQDDPNQGIPSF